jgi:hypothetical protein
VSNFQDKELTCSDCGGEFLHSAKDREFLAGKGFQEPTRRKSRRQAGKAERDGERGDKR